MNILLAVLAYLGGCVIGTTIFAGISSYIIRKHHEFIELHTEINDEPSGP